MSKRHRPQPTLGGPRPPRRSIFGTVAAAAALVGAGTGVAPAEVTINYGSITGTYNAQSTGRVMDSGFTFQLGAFRPGFTPTRDNVAEWSAAWIPVAKASGATAEGASTRYDDRFLFPDGEGEYRVNAFSGVTVLEHNSPPFNAGGDVYIWGFDNRTRAGEAEWVLLTDPLWSWPSAQGLSPAISFGISTGTVAVVGDINDGPVQLRSERVTVEPGPGFDDWVAAVAGGIALTETGDEDGDGRANLLEYYLGSDPLVPDFGPTLEVTAAGDGEAFVHHVFDAGAHGVEAVVEWSDDLRGWSSEGVAPAGEETLSGSLVLALHSLAAGRGEQPAYFRLRVTRQ